ncbi:MULTISPECIES: hypothetical protein [unclassified Frankia]|uniref:hypothetical protein n=1 Tax=unclassified Frankia TaxID=2632575 RepID=UPI001EF4C9C4|nr:MULTISPECIES: hypothetical protein [unclassified Frankia]
MTAPAVRAPRTRRTRRTRPPETIARSKRDGEGHTLEMHSVPAALRAAGYEVVFADKSRGVADHVAWRPGQLLVIATRITAVKKRSPEFSRVEQQGLWDLTRDSRRGFEVLALFATAYHAAAPGNVCACSGLTPDPVRYLRMTGPPVGQGRRPSREPWVPDTA